MSQVLTAPTPQPMNANVAVPTPIPQPTFSASLLQVMTFVGVAATVGALIYLGRKLQVLDALEATVEKIKINLQVVTTHLTREDEEFKADELVTMSPLKLTDKGIELVRLVGFEDVFTAHQAEFFAAIDEVKPRLKYDVENAAIASIYKLQDQPFMDSLKTWLYNNPSRKLTNTAPTLGVYLRDKYLAAHPEITQ